jgi:hypothetical protein
LPVKKIKGNTMKWLDQVPYLLLIIGSLTLGLAPFTPMPHLVEKMTMLLAGELVKPVDIFDLMMHASPVVLLIVKIGRTLVSSRNS